MFFYLYEITNELNGKIYIGVHKTKDLDDGYMGSGIRLNRSIKKHGVENFKKKILEYFEDAASMYEREKEIVNKDFLQRNDIYNLRLGGLGGFDSSMNESRSELMKDPNFREKYISKISKGVLKAYENPIFKEKISEHLRSQPNFSNSSFMNTPEANLKRKKTFKDIEHQKGSKNSQFGTFWITNGFANKKSSGVIPEGFRKGRVRISS